MGVISTRYTAVISTLICIRWHSSVQFVAVFLRTKIHDGGIFLGYFQWYFENGCCSLMMFFPLFHPDLRGKQLQNKGQEEESEVQDPVQNVPLRGDLPDEREREERKGGHC